MAPNEAGGPDERVPTLRPEGARRGVQQPREGEGRDGLDRAVRRRERARPRRAADALRRAVRQASRRAARRVSRLRGGARRPGPPRPPACLPPPRPPAPPPPRPPLRSPPPPPPGPP